MKKNILVRHPQQLTRAWAQAVVQRHDVDAHVSDVKILAWHSGTTTRVRLEVEHNSPKLARRWFVKLPAQAWRARAITTLPRLLQTEVRFYNEIAASVPLIVPTCLAAHSQFGRGAIVVLADITAEKAVAGHAGDTLNAAQAHHAVEQLARFHAHFWQDEGGKLHYPWLADSVRRVEDSLGSALAVPLMRRGLQKAGALIPKELHAPALHYARHRRRVMGFLANAPQTLTHHDCHLGNLFWHDNGYQVGFLDWQLVRIGEGVGDVAYLLATALTPEIRKAHEAKLLSRYVQTLNAHGVAVTFDSLMPRYRAHCSYAFEAMVVTLAVGGMMDLVSNLELIRRTTAAVQELESFTALPLT